MIVVSLNKHLSRRGVRLLKGLRYSVNRTRRYAKRQMTWIAHQFTLWPRIPSEDLSVRVRVISDIAAEG